LADVTICIPSNRPLAVSVEPLWSAINYAAACEMQVVISDNSRDPDKRDYFLNSPMHVTYIPDAPEIPAQNMLSVLGAAKSEFILMLGDDDFITHEAGMPVFDFSALGADCVGVKPRIELWGPEKGLMDINEFSVDGAGPAERIIEYWNKMKGGNSTFYSFFRAKPLRDVARLFAEHHPTRVGNADFAQVFALVAEGRMVTDPATTIRYDNRRWETQSAASEAIDSLFADAGLPPEARNYMMLLHFLDSFVLLLRQTSSLEPMERYKAGYAAAMVFLKRFLLRVEQMPEEFSSIADLAPHLKDAVESSDPDLDRIFLVASLVVDRLKPGLKSGYENYLQAAMG
jgi:hypothetical protein